MKKSLEFDLAKVNKIKFRAFGVKVCIEVGEKKQFTQILKNLPILLPVGFSFWEGDEFDFHFELKFSNGEFEIYRNRELISSGGRDLRIFTDFFLSHLRLTIAEHAVARVFIHAGVVGWKNKAIIFPAKSYGGKTTLVKELVRAGASYYSDEFAILDQRGLVHPFPKMLSVRGIIDEHLQKDIAIEALGGDVGTKPIPVGFVLFTEFKQNARWQPETLTKGQGVLEMIPHTIPIRSNPKFSLEVLNKTLNRAIIAKSKRGEAVDFINFFLKFIEK